MELSIDGTQDLKQIYQVLVDMSDLTTIAIKKWSSDEAYSALKCEDEIDKLEEVFHGRHVYRVNTGKCSVLNSEHFVEVLANVERMGDHMENICESITSLNQCKIKVLRHLFIMKINYPFKN